MKKFFSLLIIFSISFQLKSQIVENTVEDKWFFSEQGAGKWFNAKVPGCQYTDLLFNKLINHPFYSDNEIKLDSLLMKNYEYKRFFNVSEKLINKNKVLLRFEGLDTYCDIYLNDNYLGSTDNMFRIWEFSVKSYLKPDSNFLYLVFTSPLIKDSINSLKTPYSLPETRAFSRKAPFQYGWDWGPKLPTLGIWKPVKIIAYDDFIVKNVYFNQLSVEKDIAKLMLEVEIDSESSNNIEIELSCNTLNNIIINKKICIKNGINNLKLPLKVKNPKLWMPNGLGTPFLYNFNLIIKKGKTPVYNKNFEVGLRKIELVRKKDKIGESFYFKVNNIPVFIKGANYVPMNSFPTDVSKDNYISLIEKVVNANMNMLRVWGGGIYENDIFYDLCNKNGILVWQDFMFACTMYPGDSTFIENVEKEAIDNIKRLRNNACIAIWCGNNEVDEGWHNWGWQKQLNLNESDSALIWNNYLKLFHNVLPTTLRKLNVKTDYISTSPKFGWGRKESMTNGDSHYWGVWWGMEPFEKYIEKTGRFMSEYGFQSFPKMTTLRKVIDDSSMYLYSPQLKVHQKHPKGFETIDEYLKRDYKKPKDMGLYVYVSQLLQARGLKIAISSHRRAIPKCMGTLFWQLNDCWPVVSWSAIDFYSEPKALYYAAKNLFYPTLLSFIENNSKVELWNVNDFFSYKNAKIKVKHIDFDGNILWDTNIYNLKIKNTSSQKVWEADIRIFKLDKYKTNSLLISEIWDNDSILAKEIYYFTSPKNLTLKKPTIDISTKIISIDKAIITLQSNILAKDVMLESVENTEFSDNFFDLLPGEPKEIIVTSSVIRNTLRSINITDLSDIDDLSF